MNANLIHQTDISWLQRIGTKHFDSSIIGTVQEALDFIGNLLESTTEHSIIATDLNGTIQLWNEGARRLYGYEEDEVIGKANVAMLHFTEEMPSDEPREILNAALANGNWKGTLQKVCKDGRRFTARVVVTPRHDVQGHAIGFVLISNDISEEVRLSEELKAVQFYTRSLIESDIDALIATNPQGIITDVNQQMRLLTGCDRQSLIGTPFKNYFTDPQAAERGIKLALRDGHVVDHELTAIAKDGGMTAVSYNASTFRDANGVVQGVVGAARDVTELKRAEANFRGLLESAPEAMVIVNEQGRIVLVNSQTEKLFGYDRHELVNQLVEILIPKRHQIDHLAHRQAYFQRPRTRSMGMGAELFGMRKDGSEFPVEVSLSTLETEEGILVSSSIRDISERKRTERAIQEKNHELENANQAKDRFLATMSHELRTPLNAIIGFTGTLLMKLPGPLNDEQEDQLQTIERSANHLLSLINDLLDLAKIKSGKVELDLNPVSCQSVIHEVVHALTPIAQQKRLELTSQIPDQEVVVRTDRRALTQILLNLTNNALKFTKQGVVQIKLQQHDDDDGLLTEFSVIDTGIGIRPEDQVRLFQAFEQLQGNGKDMPQGTGLGLHLSQKLANLLGGQIRVESDPGKGSHFTLAIKE